jgi:hypothetical protein
MPKRVKLRLLLGLTPILLLSAWTLAGQNKPDPVAKEHIQTIVNTLPVDSSLRRSLEATYVTDEGQKQLSEIKRTISSAVLRRFMEAAVLPDGIHEPWMDNMKRAGVKLAMLEVDGVWRTETHFNPQPPKRIIYRKNYDGPGSQITDSQELASIRERGLETELQEVAVQKSKAAVWIGIDSPPKDGDFCNVEIYLFDNEWLIDHSLKTNSPTISRYDPETFLLGHAASVSDVLTVQQQLSTHKFSQQDLDNALYEAVLYPSDNTDVIALLLKAGANVNAEIRHGGTTALMNAVPQFNLSNIKLLLSSGADVSRKTRDGLTAYSIAQQQIKQFEQSGTRPPDYMPEILKLLRGETSVTRN